MLSSNDLRARTFIYYGASFITAGSFDLGGQIVGKFWVVKVECPKGSGAYAKSYSIRLRFMDPWKKYSNGKFFFLPLFRHRICHYSSLWCFDQKIYKNYNLTLVVQWDICSNYWPVV